MRRGPVRDACWSRRLRASLALATVVLLAACGNAGDDDDAGGDASGSGGATTTGVSETEIRVGGLVSLTGPLAQQFKGSADGAQAYFDLVNERGGVHGRMITMVEIRNDNTDPARNQEEARALVEQDEIFAVVPLATPVFASADFLAEAHMPVFGWRIQDEWNDHDTFYGHVGTWVEIDPPGDAGGAYGPKRLGYTKVGVLGYTAPQSADCAEAAARNYDAGGLDVVYENTSLPLGTADFTADAQKIKDAGVEFLQTCIDTNGNLNLARALQRVDYHVAMGWPTGYEQEVLAEYGDLLQDVYFGLQHRPFEEAASSPGLEEYLTELPRLAPEAVIGNQSLIGWTNAKLFVDGLEAVGPELTRERLVETINTEFTEWDADGIIWPLDWSVQHTGPNPYGCGGTSVTVESGAFVQVLGKPWNCLGRVQTEAELDAYIAAEEAGATPEEAAEAALEASE
jgi:ABC-type branched-subunit amino acid transport system substrate-binding protein